MSEIRIEVFSGTYSNFDAYEKVINYIHQKEIVGAYGAFGYTSQDYVEQFRMSEQLSHQESLQYIWHFVVSFQRLSNKDTFFGLACQIASLFKNHYQIIFALDTKGSKFHLHFGVNAYSYFPDYPVLSSECMMDYIKNIQNLLSLLYPTASISLQFQNKRRIKSCLNY